MLGEISSHALKVLIGRDRPPLDYPEPQPLVPVPDSPSLPSGHATSSFLAATLIALAVPRLAVPLYVLAALVAWSRAYTGVHYPFDLVAGAAFGVTLALVVARALPKLAAAPLRSPRAPRPG